MNEETWNVTKDIRLQLDENREFARIWLHGAQREPVPTIRVRIIGKPSSITQQMADQAAQGSVDLHPVVAPNFLELSTAQRVATEADAIDIMDTFVGDLSTIFEKRASVRPGRARTADQPTGPESKADTVSADTKRRQGYRNTPPHLR